MIISQHGHTAASPLTFLDRFDRVAKQTEYLTGHPIAFAAAVFFIAAWAMTGPLFHFGDIWQFTLVSVTSIVTFLMVFLIQNTQNRDAKAMHLKLDELIRAVQGARNRLVDLEKLSDEELKQLEEQFTRLRNKAAQHTSEAEEIEEEVRPRA